jgi:hypothetical protein
MGKVQIGTLKTGNLATHLDGSLVRCLGETATELDWTVLGCWGRTRSRVLLVRGRFSCLDWQRGNAPGRVAGALLGENANLQSSQ